MEKRQPDFEMTHKELYAAIDRLTAKYQTELVALRRDIHAHPELSNREERTSRVVADHLRSLGLDEVRTGIAGYGVVGVLQGGLRGKRVIALRADMDALPVKESTNAEFASTIVDKDYPGGPFPVAHACGHDCHVATVATVATVLTKLKDYLPGKILFVFQPAEEGPPINETGGAKAMLDAGALNNPKPTMVFGLHVSPFPKGYIAYTIGNELAASCLVRIKVEGVQVHGSTPWQGVDPMPAAATIISSAGQLYRQIPAYDLVTISISHIEDVGRFNIIPGNVTLYGTIRSSIEANMEKIQGRLTGMVENIARAYGCSSTTEYLQNVPPVNNTQVWVDAAMPTLERVVGRDAIVEAPAAMNYDDVSEFIKAFGGLYYKFGVQDTRLDPGTVLAPVKGGRGLVPNHNPAFYADEDSLQTSVRIHANIAVDHLLGMIDPSAT